MCFSAFKDFIPRTEKRPAIEMLIGNVNMHLLLRIYYQSFSNRARERETAASKHFLTENKRRSTCTKIRFDHEITTSTTTVVKRQALITERKVLFRDSVNKKCFVLMCFTFWQRPFGRAR